MIELAYFGVPGSFSEQAAKVYAEKIGSNSFHGIECPSIEHVFRTIAEKDCIGIVPTYNSTAGDVHDYLRHFDPSSFRVIDSITIDVHHCLLCKTTTRPEKISAIASHEQALRQCQTYLNKNFAGVPVFQYSNTAAAAQDLSNGILSPDHLVIASAYAAELYGIHILERNIEDAGMNHTKFSVIAATPKKR